MAGTNFIFIKRTICETWNEEFPDAGGSAIRHRMAAAVPLVEVTYDTYSRGVRRPDDKMDSGDALNCSKMGAHRLARFEKGFFGKEMQLIVGEEL